MRHEPAMKASDGTLVHGNGRRGPAKLQIQQSLEPSITNTDSPELYVNREISLLEFQRRVLEFDPLLLKVQPELGSNAVRCGESGAIIQGELHGEMGDFKENGHLANLARRKVQASQQTN